MDEKPDESLLEETLKLEDCFVLPNIHPMNYKTGPFPDLEGRILNEQEFFRNSERAFILANLSTAITTAFQIQEIVPDMNLPMVVTAGGAKDPYFGRILASLTGTCVYAMFDRDGQAITETTTLGAAIAGKAACLNIHPYDVDVSGLGVSYREMCPFDGEIRCLLDSYRKRFMQEVERHSLS